MVLLVFIGFLYPPAWKVFFEARKVLQKIFFRWWLCTLFSSLFFRAPKAKPVGRMSVLGEFDLPGVVPGCFLGRPFCASKQGFQAPGSELLGQKLGIPQTEKWPKTGHADYWVIVTGLRCSPSFSSLAKFWRIAHKFLSEFFKDIYPANFAALFLQRFRQPPPKKRITPTIHAQNCRHSSPTSDFRAHFFSRRLSGYGGKHTCGMNIP